MAQMTYQIILSTDGKHTVIVTGDNQGEMQAANAWAKATYEGIVERYGLKNGIKPLSGGQPVSSNTEEAPICQVHQVPMVLMNGRKGPFYSCHERMDDGSFCTYRPPKTA
ncbi:MAG TPA: hypothetical protein VFC51_15405 [Chloroflexota bacterium]|nr:hypothetical protein [Chloroflexota bacterium]